MSNQSAMTIIMILFGTLLVLGYATMDPSGKAATVSGTTNFAVIAAIQPGVLLAAWAMQKWRFGEGADKLSRKECAVVVVLGLVLALGAAMLCHRFVPMQFETLDKVLESSAASHGR